jgi:hypothetical protein
MRARSSARRIIGATTAAAWCAAAFAGGCGPERRDAARRAETAGRAWSVTTGARGGVTGGGSGHVVAGDGRVSAWSQITPSDSLTSEPIGLATPEALAALDAALHALDPQALKLQETGNMTAFLEWRDPPRTQRWSWPERAGGAKLPPALQRAVDAAAAAVQSARR